MLFVPHQPPNYNFHVPPGSIPFDVIQGVVPASLECVNRRLAETLYKSIFLLLFRWLLGSLGLLGLLGYFVLISFLFICSELKAAEKKLVAIVRTQAGQKKEAIVNKEALGLRSQ